MKIYNKKNFLLGLFSTLLGILTIFAGLRTDFDIKNIIIVFCLFLIGLSQISRSLSKKLTKEDQLKTMDERNQFVALKSKSKSFQLTQLICFITMLAFLLLGKQYGCYEFIGIGVGLAFAFSISMFSEIFTYFYYENHI